MGDVDHGDVELLVDLLELAAQLPLEVGVDDRQRFIEQDGGHVIAHQATAHRDLLLLVGRQVAGTPRQQVFQLQHLGDLTHPGLHLVLRLALIAQREGQIVEDRHGVVDHRELENLGNVALFRRQPIDHAIIEAHLALGGGQQPGDDVEQRALATPRRAEQCIGAALLPDMIHAPDGVITVRGGRRQVAVRQIIEVYFRHQASPPPVVVGRSGERISAPSPCCSAPSPPSAA